MRIAKDFFVSSTQKVTLFADLVKECQMACPGSRLSDKLRRKIEEIGRNDRKDVVGQTADGCAPLFWACKNGSADVVEYLLTTCEADIEQRGLFDVPDEGVSHSVTPLWAAAVSGRLAVVKTLLRHGADVDAVSDSGSTPVRSACYIVRPGIGGTTNHLDIVKCLVKAGADVHRANHFGGTCLINSVQSPELVKFLIDAGHVNVNAKDVQNKTALHYAIQENRIESAKILLESGSNPFVVSKYGDDILQTACLKGNLTIFNYLLENVVYEPGRIAEAFELMGSTFLMDLHDVSSTLFFWRKSVQIRHDGEFKKYPKNINDSHPIVDAVEFDSLEELEVITDDSHALKMQALLVSERILGMSHKDTVFRYMYAGASYADASQYKQCISLWNYALKLKADKETILSCDSCFTARAIVQLFLNIMSRNRSNEVESLPISFNDVANTTSLINNGLNEAIDLIEVKPVCKAQVDNFDIVLTTWIHLVYILLKLAQNDEDRDRTQNLVWPILKKDPRMSTTKDSLLHMCASSGSTLKSNSFLDDDTLPPFPCPMVTSFFVSMCQGKASPRNRNQETPLHIACKPENFSKNVVKIFLDAGVHPDHPDARNITPLDILRAYNNDEIQVALSLKCLATNAVLRSFHNKAKSIQHLKVNGMLPRNLIDNLVKHSKCERIYH